MVANMMIRLDQVINDIFPVLVNRPCLVETGIIRLYSLATPCCLLISLLKGILDYYSQSQEVFYSSRKR